MGKLRIALCLFFCISNLSAIDVKTEPFTVAAIEFNPQFMQLDENIVALHQLAEKAALKGAKLLVFPEMATCGYIYKDRAQIDPFLDTIPGKTTQALEKITSRFGVYIAIGIGEIDPVTGMGFNAAALIGPKGYIGKYRKVGLDTTDQAWTSAGNLGHPVFATELGNISLLISYDDVYFETSRLSSLKGADIIAFLANSNQEDRSTIANVQYMAAWNGVYLIAANRSNTEANPLTGLSIQYNSSSSVWNSSGKKIAQLSNSDQILFAQIDPKTYRNPLKDLMKRRRPELYKDLTLFRAPEDPRASSSSSSIASVVIQYTPILGDKAENFKKIRQLLDKRSEILTKWHLPQPNLIVLPAYSLTGFSSDPNIMQNLAEPIDGPIIADCTELAITFGSHIVFSMLEKDNDKFFHTAVILGPQGEILGKYRQTHLNAAVGWLQPGDEISTFTTSIGRIGLMLDDDVLFPEVAGVHCVHRADILVVPTQWNGAYGTTVDIAPTLLAKPFPANTMIYWYAIAQCAQSCVVVANYVGSDSAYLGSSGVYSLNPVMGHYPPTLATQDREEAFYTSFKTLGESDEWMNQRKLIIGRRADLAVPLIIPMAKTAFTLWKNSPGFNTTPWIKQ